jgi:hypothetical protein
MNDISFHLQEHGKLVCFLLKHMAKKIRNCLILSRSRPTPELAVLYFHAVFNHFTPISVQQCAHDPSSAVKPTRIFVGIPPSSSTRTDPLSTQAEPSSTTMRELFSDHDGSPVGNGTSVDLNGLTDQDPK